VTVYRSLDGHSADTFLTTHVLLMVILRLNVYVFVRLGSPFCNNKSFCYLAFLWLTVKGVLLYVYHSGKYNSLMSVVDLTCRDISTLN